MKLLVILLLLGLTSAGPVWPNLSTDRTYWYTYQTTSVSGVPRTSDNSTGIQMTMKVAITFINSTRAVLQITQCTAAAFVGKYPEEVYLHSFQEEGLTVHSFENDELADCDDMQARCLLFDSYNGRITEIYPSPEDSVRILNLKRGILTAFQGVPEREDGRFTEEQTDCLGRCIFKVRKDSTKDEVYLMKTRDTETCPNRSIEFSTILPPSKHQEAKFVFGETTTHMKYVREGHYLILQRSEVVEKQSIAPISKEAGSIVVTISQVLARTTRQDTLPSCTTTPLPGPPKTLECYFPLPTCERDREQCKPKPIIDSMAVMEDPAQIAEYFAKLVEEMRRCSYPSLMNLKNEYAQCKSPNEGILRKKHTYFLDALAWLGTEPALELISELAKNNDMCLNASRRRELIVSLSLIPLHRLCSRCKWLNITWEIAKYNNYNMTSTLVLGAVIRLVLKDPQNNCSTELNMALDWLMEKYARTTDIKEKIHVLKALGNAGSLRGLPVIEDALWTTPRQNNELIFEQRLAAIYALERMSVKAPHKIHSLVLPIYYNTTEKVEARIAAFLVFIRSSAIDIPPSEFIKFVKSLQNEADQYVRSYVYTYLVEAERSTNPQMMRIKESVSYVLKVTNAHYWCRDCDRGYFSSKAKYNYGSLADFNWPRPLPRDVMGVGLASGFVFTNVSNLPRSGIMSVTANAFGYDFQLLEVGVRALGTSKLIERLFGPTGYIRLGTRILKPSGMAGAERMCYLEEEPMWFSGYIKAFGNELAWNRADEEGVNKALYTSDKFNNLRTIITEVVMSRFKFDHVTDIFSGVKDYLKYFITGKFPVYHNSMSVTKSSTIVDIKRSIPSIMGLPLNVTAIATVMAHLDAEGDISVVKSTNIEVSGEITPKVATYANITVVLDAGRSRVQPRVVHIGKVKSSFKQRARLTVTNEYETDLYIDQMPRDPESTVFEAKYYQYVEVAGKKMEMGIWKRNETELYERVGGNYTNIEFITPVSYPNSTDVPEAPFFPLSGPAGIKLILRPLTPSPSEHHFKIWNDSKVSTERGTIYSYFATDHERTVKGIFDWYTVGERPTQLRVINLTATSIPAVASGIFLANTSRMMDIEGWISLNTTISNTWGHVKFNKSMFHGNLTRMRIAPDNDTVIIKIPEFMAEVNGSLTNGTHGNMSAILYLEGCSDMPQWLRVNFTSIKLMVNITAESSYFNRTNVGYILPYPLKSPVCTYFNGRVITFDGLSYPIMQPQCDYILSRHRNASDNFAVVARRGGRQVDVYINGTKYTLGRWGLRVNDIEKSMPHKLKHEIHIREVNVGVHKYIRLSSYVGIDIFFNGRGIHLSINGFYMNQTAGLCANSNYNSSKADELESSRPNCHVVDTIPEFVSGWALNTSCLPGSPTSPPSYPPFDQTMLMSAMNVCTPLFHEAAAEAHPFVSVHNYMEACIQDVSSGKGPVESLFAYIMAAAASKVAVEGCHYEKWSAWSGCEDRSKQWEERHRSVLENPLNVTCSQTIERRQCQKVCPGYKDYIRKDTDKKKCISKYTYHHCPPTCTPVLQQEQPVAFHCALHDESDDIMANVSPVYLMHRKIVLCLEN